MLIAFEVILMIKYDFSVDGIPVAIYPLSSFNGSAPELCCVEDAGIKAFLYPDSDADFGVTSFDKNNRELREPNLIFAALFCFFLRARGYPDMTLAVKYFDKIYELEINNETYRFTENIEKCKVLCSKIIKTNDDIEIDVRYIALTDTAMCISAFDADTFDRERLNLLLHLHGRNADFAVAVSYGDKVRILGVEAFTPYRAIAAGIAALCADGVIFDDGAYAVEYNGEEYRVFKSRAHLTFYPSVKYLY